MRLDTLAMGILTMILILGLGLLIIDDQRAGNPEFINMSNSSSFANLTKKVNNMSLLAGDLKDTIKPSEVETGLDVFGFLLTAGKNTLNTFYEILTIPGEFFTAIADTLGIPHIVEVLTQAALGILVAFSIVYLFFRFQNR